MMRSKNEPVLTSVNDLDNGQVSDICLGLQDGPGGRFRVLQRMRTTPREAVRVASQTASELAGATSEVVLDPEKRPSAIRVSDSPEGSWIALDYDVGTVDKGRPRLSRPLRLMMLNRG